ncbi:MAG: hypothetical protein M3Q97_09750 [Bacteroidota bacterium]|nr:hypothetical protein [Bacteroidota bacterium]
MLLIEDLIIGLVKGICNKKPVIASGLIHMKHAFRVWQGLFAGSPSVILRRWFWEQPQTFLGFFTAFIAIWIRPVRQVVQFEGYTILLGAGWRGSMSLGTYLFLNRDHKAGAGEGVFMHEFGHSLQSRKSGPLFLFKYGIPSIVTNNYYWTEADANLRSALYFRDRYGIPFSEWKKSRFSQIPDDLADPRVWEYVLLTIIVAALAGIIYLLSD